MKSFRSMASLLALSVALAACGGGGSTGGGVNPIPTPPPPPSPPPPSPPTAFSNWQSTPSSGTLRLTGKSVEATYVPSQMNGTIGSYNTPGSGNVNVDIAYSGGSQTGVSVSGNLSTIATAAGDGSTKIGLAGNPNIIKYSWPSSSSSLLMADASSSGYSYMTYGAWTGSASNTGYISSFHAGSLTPPSSVPTSGSATYRGSAVGYYSCVNCSVRESTSTVTLTADFGNRSIYYVASNSTLRNLDVAGTLTYNAGSNSFSGTLSTPSSYSGEGAVSGLATGSFYGPTGQEAAGTFLLTRPLGQYVGSFGAVRQGN